MAEERGGIHKRELAAIDRGGNSAVQFSPFLLSPHNRHRRSHSSARVREGEWPSFVKAIHLRERLTNLDVELVLGAALQVPERVVRVRNVAVVSKQHLEFVKHFHSLGW